MNKVLIIEDDHFSAARLKRLIMDIDDTIDVHGPLKSVMEVAADLSAHNDYDLIFSDIRLVDGDVFEAFKEVMPQSFVIFTTAFDEYAMEAIKNNGLDYLMKPVDADRLRVAVNKLRLNPTLRQEVVESRLNGVLHDTCRYRKRFLVSKGDELCMLCTDDISYICTEGNHVLAFTDDGTSYPLSMVMNKLEQVLDPNKFFRLNRKYIANIEGIKKISLFFGFKLAVKLKGCSDDNIIISKEKTAHLKKWLDR
ncbi:MAG: LytTR family DNA-binding domain-containing protein [Prevotellaceae bacterium]|nr:LytTR family DNA-binding domain-containing protein [Prevotellaceae bacterium]MDY2633637.1 LytTR family DNA-binding domain-containing protein [Prevotella sp.]